MGAVLYDLSPPASPALAVFPGDTPLSREVLLDMRDGDPLTLSTLRATVHLGSHVDAPSHYGAEADTIDRRALGRFVGLCQVIRVPGRRGDLVGTDDVRGPIAAPRVLLATDTFPDPTSFNPDFAALSPGLVDWLADRGVTLVGIDTPSVDPADSKDLLAHRRCLARDVSILEGIVLRGVPEGEYELIALPLKLVGFDASPVRAVLRAPPSRGSDVAR